MVYFPSIFGLGIPTSYPQVEASSPMTPVTNYFSGIDSYGSFGRGAGTLFGGGGGYFGADPIGYGRFSYDPPLIMPFFMPSIPWLVPMGNAGNEAKPVNIADFITFGSTPAANPPEPEIADTSATPDQDSAKKIKKKPATSKPPKATPLGPDKPPKATPPDVTSSWRGWLPPIPKPEKPN